MTDERSEPTRARGPSSATSVGAASSTAPTPAWSTSKTARCSASVPPATTSKYTKEEVKPWVMKARGKTFEPSEKSLIPPLSLAYKKRVYSPARIRYPMKRVDFDPKGERNPQNRGVSKYERISWDEALDIITSEMLRIKETYGPTAILYQSDQHGENKVVHGPHGCGRKLLKLLGGYTLQVRNPDSWEGWWWGAKHVWGMRAGRPADAPEEPYLRYLQEHRAAAASGDVTRRPRPGGGRGSSPAA